MFFHLLFHSLFHTRCSRFSPLSEGLDHIILVTSSFHMPRSKRLFDHAGINNVAYPTDFQANATTNWLDMIPSAKAFKETSSGLREYIGRMYYWLRF